VALQQQAPENNGQAHRSRPSVWGLYAMNIATAKLVVLSVLGLVAGSLTVLLIEARSEIEEAPQAVFSDPNREPTTDALSLRIVAKSRIARDLIAGRFSLLQGAALFGALNRVPAQSAKLSVLDAQVSRLGVRPRTDQERLCRQVIDYVASALAADPDRQETAVAHLEAVFMDELHRQGTIQLPDVSWLVSVEQLLEEAGTELAEQRQGVTAGTKIVRPGSPGEPCTGPG
jgi:hypothetical protein